MNARHSRLHGTRQLDIETAVHIRRKSCLHANFGGTHVHGFLRAADDLLKGQKVAFFVAVCTAEGAESAMLHADIREVHIAVDDVCHHVADLTPA